MKDFFQKLEEKLLTQEVRASEKELSTLLDNDFIEYGSSWNIYNKDYILDRLPKSPFTQILISDFEIFPISESFVQTRFKTQEFEDNRFCLRSSIWEKYWDNDWKMIFHQWTITQSK